MSFIKQTAKGLTRFIAIGLLITMVSTLVLASQWDDVKAFAEQSFGYNQSESLQNTVTPLIPKTLNNEAFAPLSGTYNIPGDYTDLAAAITDLNAQGVGGAVTLNLLAGNPQTAPAGGYVIGGTGSLVLTTTSATNTVLIQGNSNNITASGALTSGALNDGIFKLIGADFVTLDSLKMLENAANTTTTAASNNMTEWGVALLYVTTTDGAQNDSITNCTVDLDRTYQNTFGIYANATHSATAVTTSATATGTAGGNSGLKIQANVITDVNNGIVVVGPTAAADQNTTIDIGGTALAFGNTISNFGTTPTFSGYANVSGTVNGILVRNNKNFNVSFNNIQSSNGGMTVSGTMNGIQVPASSNAPTGTLTQTINNNAISLRPGVAGAIVNGINLPSSSNNATTTLSISNNDFNTFGHTVAATAAITGITYSSIAATMNVNGNTFTNLSVNTTGNFTFITRASNMTATSVENVNNNSIVTGFNKTGAGGTVTLFGANASSVQGSAMNNTGNNFSNITVTGATTIVGWSNTEGASATSGPTKTISNNTFSNWTGGTSAVTGLNVNFSGPGSVINNNTISNITNGSTVTGFANGGSSQSTTATGNIINTLTSSGASVVTGASLTASTSLSLLKSKIYDLSSTNAGGSVVGVLISGGVTMTAANNLIGNLTTTVGSGSDIIRGISVTSTTTASNINLSFNTVYLNAASSGTNLGSSALFHATSGTATTANLVLKNNILVNTSTAAGTGLTVAYRRSTATLTNFDTTSNNNLFYAGTPSATNLIFNDGTNSDQLLANYKIRVTPRDSASVSENPPFLSTTGSNANFLHISTAIATQAESGGITVAGITDDFDGNTRNVSTPDIGADEFTGILLDVNGPNVIYTALGNTTSTANRTLAVTITDASGVASGALAPRIYFRKNGGSYFSTQCTGTSPSYTCTIDYSLVGGAATTDVIDYFVIAQDTAGNVSINPSTGASATDVNTVTTPPSTPSTYTITAPFPSTVNVPGDYPSLTNTGGLFEAMNAGTFTGSTIVNITADLTAETGTVALNKLSEEGAGAGTYTVLIRPSGAARIISGATTSNAMVRTNGASRVTIDGSLSGGTDRSLTINNTSATSPSVIRFGSTGTTPIVGDTLKNCIIINGVNTSSAVLIQDSSGTAGYFNNITIQNNDIQKAFVGVFGNAALLAGNGSGTLYTQNKVDTFGANAIRIVGLYMQGIDGGTISNNTVGNFDTTNDENDTGIWLATGTVNTTISGNTVSGIGYTGTSTFTPFGIRESSGSAASGNVITQNTVSNITSNGSSTSGPTVFGIDDTGSGTIIQRNNVQGINATNTGTFGAAGINIATGNNVVVRNNFVSNVTGNMTGGAAFSTTFGVFGIRVAAGTGHVIANNSVNLYGARAGTATTSLLTAALAVVSTASTGMDIRNNIFANNITGGTTSIANVSVFLPSGGTSAMNLTWNNNSYYFGTDAARQGVGQAGTTAGTNFFTTLPALAAYSSTLSAGGTNDNASLASTGAVPFATANDLHITNTAAEFNTGATIASVTNDFDGETRPQGAAYDIGADEVTVALPGTIQFSAATYSVTEGTPTVTLTVTRTGGSGGAVTANYSLGGGTATGTAACGTPGEDYVNTGGSVSFADGDAADKTFTVAICNDAVYELAQTFDATLSIGSGSATLGTPNPATVTINNDDAAPTIAVGDRALPEGNSGTTTFNFTLTVTGPSEVSAFTSIATADGTATTADSDYSSFTAGFSVPADVNRTVDAGSSVPVSVNGDTRFEANETFFVNLTGCTDCTLSDNQGLGTIQNDDVQPTVQFSSATYTNGDDIAQNLGKGDELVPEVASITVTRTGATGDAFSVNYATLNGTATGGASCTTGVDYISASGTLNFAAGDTSKSFDVTVCTDALFEGSETVNLALTGPTAPILLGTPATAVLTLTDNETVPSLQFSSATYTNSDDIAKFGVTTDEFAPSAATITVTRTGATDNAVTVNYATSNGTATGGASCTTGVDYISTNGTLSFAAGDTSQTFNVTVCTDALFEGNETVNLTLSSPSSPAALGTPNTAVLTIIDNDAQPSLQFSSATYSVGEAGPTSTITVTRTGAADNAVSVNYATSNGTATGGATCTAGVDYISASGTLSFAAGDTSKTFNVSICDDAVAESSETVNLALSAPSGGAVLGTPNTAVLTITDNDTAPTLQFSSATYSAAENVAGGVVTLTVTRSGATGAPATVDYATGGGTATAGACAPGVDYNSASGSLTFNPGDTSKTFNVTICNDSVYELNQTFDATLSNALGATLGTPNPATVTINNDDAAPTVTINDISQAEGNAGTTNFQVTFTVTGANEVSGGFNFQTADGTATAPSDYAAIPPTAAVIPANVNRTTATLNGSIVLVNGDTTVEPDETFFLNGSSCTDCSFTDNQGLATILNDDTSVQFAQPLYTVSEGVGTVTLTVTRAGSSTGAVSVNYAFAGITANGAASCGAGIDFAAVSGTLNWASGDSASKTFNVAICDDALPESTESFVSQLQSPTGATIGAQSSTQVDITDNDSDSIAPVITYTPIPNNPGTTVVTPTITDAVGVTGASVFWSINGGVFTSAPCTFASGTAQNGNWTCTITGTSVPNSVAYYVTATDGTNTATNPTGGATAPNLFTIGSATVPAGTYTNLRLGDGVNLGGNVDVLSSLNLNGIVNTGANKLTLECTATVTGGGENSYVVGRLEKFFCGIGSFTFNVGAPFALPPVAEGEQPIAPEGLPSNYSPVTVNVTGGTVGSSLTVNAVDAFLAGSDPTGSASRYWTLTESGSIIADLSFTYRNEDVNGDESTYKVLRRASGMTIRSISSTNNPATNTGTITNVSNFSDWAVGNAIPTAANADISGRVTTADGTGISNATVVISGGNLTAPVTVRTGTFGYYNFSGLPVGETYVITVVSKRYVFTNPTHIISLVDSITGEDFIAESN